MYCNTKNPMYAFQPGVDFNNFFNSMFDTTSNPRINVLKTENGKELHIALPGVKKDNVEINISERLLALEIKNPESNSISGNYVVKQFEAHSGKWEYRLSDKIDTELIDAQFADGILIIKLPYKVVDIEKKSKKINLS